VSGENHPDTSFSGHNVANILAEQERFAEAIPMYERVLAVREAAFGPENPRVADVLANMAAAHGDMGEYDESVTYARRAIAIYERATGVDHAKSLAARATLGVALMQLGRLDEARGVLQAVLSGQEAVHGEHHAQVVDALVNLASIDLAADAPLPAIERLERARAIFLGLENRPPSLGPVIAHLRARAFAGVGRCDEALRALDESGMRPRRLKGPCDDVDVARQHCPTLPVPAWCTGE